MSLDDKLREVLEEPSKYIDQDIALIKQAFADEGIKKYDKLISEQDIYKIKVINLKEFTTMTGQEWYDRFSTALVGYACLPVDAGSVMWDSGDVMRAAKKAAGLIE